MIQRRWPETLFAAALCVVLFAAAAACLRAHTFWGLILGLLGFSAAVYALLGPASAECPLCKAMNHNLFALGLGDVEPCEHCRKYYRPADRTEAPADYISRTPYFPVPVDKPLPSLCCLCAAPASRVKDVVQLDSGRQFEGKIVRAKITVPVPYCAQHDEHILLQRNDERWVLRVRSYAFYRAAVLS